MAQVQLGGSQRYAMRVWLDRQALAARGLTVNDLEQALRREMHRDIKALREEVAALRESLERRAPTSMGSRESCERRKAANENVAGKAGP